MTQLVLIAYNLLFPFCFLLYLPFFVTKLVKRGNYKKGFGERFGFYSAAKLRLFASRPRPVWIHAVSVGEAVAALTLIKEWRNLEPDCTFVLSTTTSTAQQLVRDRAPEKVVPIYFPIDFFACGYRALKAIDPRILVIFEVEIWPNIIVAASNRKVPTALVNGRMSDQSARGYQKYRFFFRQIFSRFSVICTQTEEDAARLKSILVNDNKIHVCGSMKFDQAPGIAGGDAMEILNRVFIDDNRRIIAAASTHPGEESVIADISKALMADHPEVYYIIIPRHVERTCEIATDLSRKGLSYYLLTRLRQTSDDLDLDNHAGSTASNCGPRILIVDTTGEMMNFLAASDIVFMGKSLCGNHGGHNIIEPAILAKPIVFGSHMENFRLIAQLFKDNKACIEVRDSNELLDAFRTLLTSPDDCRRLAEASLATVRKYQGSTKKTLTLLTEIL